MGSSMTVDVEQMDDAIVAMVKDTCQDVVNASRKDVAAAARVSLNILKSTSPRQTGMYAGNWAMRTKLMALGHECTVYENAPSYRLTHLLEHGHGGPAPAPAYPHIAAAAEAGAAELERRMHV